MIAAGLARPGDGERRLARFLLQPRDVSDHRCARARGGVRRARARSRRQAQIHQHRRDHALLQGPAALQFRHRPPRRDQGADRHRRRRLYGRDRAGARGFRPCGGAARHRAHRGPAPAPLAHRAGTDSRPSTATRRDCAPRTAPPRLALPMLKPGTSLRFAFLPTGEDPDSFIARRRRGRDEGSCSTRPSRCRRCSGAARPRARISPRPNAARAWSGRWPRSFPRSATRRSPTTTAATSTSASSTPSSAMRPGRARTRSPSVAADLKGAASAAAIPRLWRGCRPPLKASAARPLGPQRGAPDARRLSLPGLLLKEPEIAERQGEILAALPFSDRFA